MIEVALDRLALDGMDIVAELDPLELLAADWVEMILLLPILVEEMVLLEGDALPLSGLLVNEGLEIPPDEELAVDELTDTGAEVVNVFVIFPEVLVTMTLVKLVDEALLVVLRLEVVV